VKRPPFTVWSGLKAVDVSSSVQSVKARKLFMRKIISIGLLLALGGMIFLTVRQRNASADLRRENALLRQQLVDIKQAHDTLAESSRRQAEQLQKLQSEKGEAIRLRGEMTRLRQQLKEAELATRAALRPTNSTSAEATGAKPMVESFRAVVRARLAWSQTLVTGGWKTDEGKHTFVFVEPQKVTGEGPLQLELRTKYLELPDELLAKHGLAGLVADKNESTTQSSLTREQMRALFESLKDQPGVDLLSAPTVTTLDGRQAQVKAVDVIKTPDGQELELGPSVDIIGKATEDGEFIDLTVLAHLNRRSK
jgi:hypothetical protein